jgi:hypothetical protein
MTTAIPAQRIAGLSKREQKVLGDVMLRASRRLRFAQLTARTDLENAQQQVDEIGLYVIREAYRLLGAQRCGFLDQRETFAWVGSAIIEGARQLDGAQ